MNAPSVDIKDILLDDSSLGLTFGTDLFIGKEPSTPNNTVTIYDTPGGPDQLLLSSEKYEYPSIQIRVRNTNYLDGWSLISLIKNALHGRANETWNSTLYTVIYCLNGPAMLDWDDNGRVRFVVNFNLQRRETS